MSERTTARPCLSILHAPGGRVTSGSEVTIIINEEDGERVSSPAVAGTCIVIRILPMMTTDRTSRTYCHLPIVESLVCGKD